MGGFSLGVGGGGGRGGGGEGGGGGGMGTLGAAMSERGAAGGCRGHRARGCPRRPRTRAESGGAGFVATPSATGSRCSASRAAQGAWAWRVGGHHVAIQVTLDDGAVVGGTPSFLGSEPGRRAGGTDRGLPDAHREEILARDLLTNLSPEARAIAVVDPIAPPRSIAVSAPGPIFGRSRRDPPRRSRGPGAGAS